MAAPLFLLGRLVATPRALALLAEAGADELELLGQCASGDWCDVPPEDAREHRRSLGTVGAC